MQWMSIFGFDKKFRFGFLLPASQQMLYQPIVLYQYSIFPLFLKFLNYYLKLIKIYLQKIKERYSKIIYFCFLE